jgi:hypothetical protein
MDREREREKEGWGHTPHAGGRASTPCGAPPGRGFCRVQRSEPAAAAWSCGRSHASRRAGQARGEAVWCLGWSGEDGSSLPGGLSASILSLLACRATVQSDGFLLTLQYACCVTREDSSLNRMPCTWVIELNSAALPPHLSQRPTPKQSIAIRDFQLKNVLPCRRWKHFAITVCLAESFSCWTLIYDRTRAALLPWSSPSRET